MRTLTLGLLAALILPAGAQDSLLDEPAKPVARARQLHAKADEALKIAEPALEALRQKQEPTPDAVVAAVPAIEDAVFYLERSLHVEWSRTINERLVEAVKAWFKLRPMLPAAPEITDEKERKRAAAAQKRAKRSLMRDVRRRIMDYGKARSFRQLYQRCSRCDGRGEILNPLNKDRYTCRKCHKGANLVAQNLIRGQWLVHSPLYRAGGRTASSFTRTMTSAKLKPHLLGPFVHTLRIDGKIEDHDTWVRIETEEKIHEEPHAKRFEKVERVYRFFRVGRVWYLYSARHDGTVLQLPEEEEDS